MFLAIETATRQLGVAVIDDSGIRAQFELVTAGNPHAVELPLAVKRVLAEARTSLEKLTAVIIDIGPGSFTGLRIGLAFTKALVFPKRLPVVAVPSLDVLAAQVPFAPHPVCPILDARRRNVYAAYYLVGSRQLKRQTDYLLASPDEALAKADGSTVFLGDGVPLYRAAILERCPKAIFAPEELWLPRAATLARLGRDRFNDGQRDDPATLTPMYLYPMDCSVRLEEKIAATAKG
jgi:tRNA threonylcarbamoyladenosine biosynthesis protein TsaB